MKVKANQTATEQDYSVDSFSQSKVHNGSQSDFVMTQKPLHELTIN